MVPFFYGIRPIKFHELPRNILAGVTLAVIAIPEVMGYTKIAQTPIQTGIYTMLLPMLVFAIVGTSKHLVVAADSATAAILAQRITMLAHPASAEYMSYVTLLALLVGVLLLLCRFLKLGFIAKFLSRTVLVGFLTGVGIQVAYSQIPTMIKNSYTIVFSVLVILLILTPAILFRRIAILHKIPWALLAIILSIVVTYVWGFHTYVETIGTVPSGLPTFAIPSISLVTLSDLLPTALIIVIVIITQSSATSVIYATRYDETYDANSDLPGLGLANVAAAFTGTFVVNGSPTKTQIVDENGGRNQIAHLSAILVTLVVILFFTSPLQYLPSAVLAALVFTIGVKLIDIKNFKLIYQKKRREFYLAVLTAIVVVVAGVAYGLVLAIVLALMEHTYRGYNPKNSLLHPVPLENEHYAWEWKSINSKQQAKPGLVIYHFAAAMYYANVDRFVEEVQNLCSEIPDVKQLAIDFSAIADVDYSASLVLLNLIRKMKDGQIVISFVQVEEHVMEQLISYGIIDVLGQDRVYERLSELMRENFANES